MTYSQRLRDPRWQKRRLFILERDGWKCLSCGSTTKNLQVHHIIYERGRDPWDYADNELKTYCDDCHMERQKISDCLANRVRISIEDVPTRIVGLVFNDVFSKKLSDDSECYPVMRAVFKSVGNTIPDETFIERGLFVDTLKQFLSVQSLNAHEGNWDSLRASLASRLRSCADQLEGGHFVKTGGIK